MTLQAPTEQDMIEWVRALRLHQIDLFRARSIVFEQWLAKQGIKIPGSSSLKTQNTLDFIEDGMEKQVVDNTLEEESKQ